MWPHSGGMRGGQQLSFSLPHLDVTRLQISMMNATRRSSV